MQNNKICNQNAELYFGLGQIISGGAFCAIKLFLIIYSEKFQRNIRGGVQIWRMYKLKPLTLGKFCSPGIPEVYSEPYQTSTMELFAEMVSGFQPLTILVKCSISDV